MNLSHIAIPLELWETFIDEHYERQNIEDDGEHDCRQSAKPACKFITSVVEILGR